jgi:hypothetical protein
MVSVRTSFEYSIYDYSLAESAVTDFFVLLILIIIFFLFSVVIFVC